MKKWMLMFVTFVLCTTVTGQIVTVSSSSDAFKSLVNSEVSFVVTGNKDFDLAVENAVKKYWTITQFKFVKIEEVDQVISDKNNFFIFPLISVVTSTSVKEINLPNPTSNRESVMSKTSTSSKTKSWYAIVRGGKKSLKKYGDNDAICLTPFNLYCDEEDYKKSSYRMEYMIKALNDGIEIVKSKSIEGNALSMPLQVMDEINKNCNAIKSKTLIINSDQVNIKNTNICEKEDFKENYPYKYQFVSDAEFKEILKGNSSEYLCLMPVFEVNMHMIIYDPSSRETVYYGLRMQGLKVSAKIIKKMIEKCGN